MKTAKLVIAIFLALLFPAAAMGGYEKAAKDKAKAKDDIYAQVELLADAISIVRNEYVEEANSKKLIYGSMKGMLSSLDDYSSFLDPAEFEEIKTETRGEFGGVGLEVAMKDDILTVITPIVGTPAETAGIKPGDKIVKIDGKITRDIRIADAVKQLRGLPGTTVNLTIWREKDEKILEIPLKRAVIKVASVKKAILIEEKIGYIKLIEFQENTSADLEDALKKLEAEGMDCLILDLRYNPGGLLDGAVDICEKFLPKDEVMVSIKARDPKLSKVFKSSGRHCHPDYPLVVIVNEGSASASEIFSGAVQDNRRGLVLGARTYGKASVQAVIPLKDGSALKLTTALYLTPNGRLIKDQGVVPDVVVEAIEPSEAKKKRSAEIFERIGENQPDKPNEPTPKEDLLSGDNQLAAAVNLMKAIKIYKR